MKNSSILVNIRRGNLELIILIQIFTLYLILQTKELDIVIIDHIYNKKK